MLGRNVQAYVDDMVVTSPEKSKHAEDLGVVHHDRQVQIEADPREVHFWRGGREVLGIPLN